MQVVKVVGGLIPVLMQQDPSSESVCGCLLLAMLLQIPDAGSLAVHS